MKRTLLIAVLAALMVAAMGASAAFAGEVTGNGKSLHQAGGGLHGQSACAFSGQEDLQFFTDEFNQIPLETVTKGDPGHAQSWGQIPKVVRDEIAAFGAHPGMACNPTKAEFEE